MSETFEGERICYIEPFDAESSTIEYREEIVRCRDCKRFHPKEGAMFACKFEYGEFTQWRSAEPDGFCAWACRKEQQSWGERK